MAVDDECRIRLERTLLLAALREDMLETEVIKSSPCEVLPMGNQHPYPLSVILPLYCKGWKIGE